MPIENRNPGWMMPQGPVWSLERVLSSAICVLWLTIGGVAAGLEGVLRLGMFLVVPMACIWFSESLGEAVGFMSSGVYVSRSSPEWAVRLLGWVVLLMPAWGTLLSLLW